MMHLSGPVLSLFMAAFPYHNCDNNNNNNNNNNNKQNHQTCATVGSILMADVKCSWESSGSPTSLQHALIQIPELTNNQNKT